jgi:hypothetical protein
MRISVKQPDPGPAIELSPEDRERLELALRELHRFVEKMKRLVDDEVGAGRQVPFVAKPERTDSGSP